MFPAEIVPVSVFLSTLVSHLLAVALMVAAAGLWINQISIFLVLLPIYMLTVGLFAVGVGWIVASLHVFLRDTAQMLSVILTFWFWATPIFIAEGKFPHWAAFLLRFNPLYYVVRSYRAILLHSDRAKFPRPGDFRGVRNCGFRGRRTVLPLHEARIRRRSLTGPKRASWLRFLLATSICELLLVQIPLIGLAPLPTTAAVATAMNVINREYSIKSWPSSSRHKV